MENLINHTIWELATLIGYFHPVEIGFSLPAQNGAVQAAEDTFFAQELSLTLQKVER